MTATEIEMMTATKMLLDQFISDQPILMKHLELRRHGIPPQTATDALIQN